MKKLNEVKIGQQVEIVDFLDQTIKCLSTRLGIEKGQLVTCIAKLGAVIIRKNQQEIAIGENLCKQIFIRII